MEKVEKVYNKLVRDNILEIIKEEGNEPIAYVLDDKKYKRYLFEKLHEEVREFSDDECIEELCDVLEVIDALKMTLGFSDEAIEDIKNKKAKKNGSFKKKLFLEKVIINK